MAHTAYPRFALVVALMAFTRCMRTQGKIGMNARNHGVIPINFMYFECLLSVGIRLVAIMVKSIPFRFP